MTLVTGDPASMRAAAAELRLHADTLGAIGPQVGAQVAAMTYSGPAAERFRGAIDSHDSALQAVCARMVNTADTLTRQAAVLEEQLLTQAAQRGY